MSVDLTVVILTKNEQTNIEQALRTVCGWATNVFVVDSFSEDRTVELCREWGCDVFLFPFEGYSQQRNRALSELPFTTEWILFLDADEWIPEELKREISSMIAGNPIENGFFLRRRFYWMGAWIRRGYYPVWILRLFRRGTGVCEDRSVNEHMVIQGAAGYLRNDFIHQDRKPFSDWIHKHNGYALREAKELFKRQGRQGKLRPKFLGSQAERVRWLREHIYNSLPPLIRPFLFFAYRVVVRGGMLDGWRAFLYHFFQAFWYPLLVDVYYLELKQQHPTAAANVSATGTQAVAKQS